MTDDQRPDPLRSPALGRDGASPVRHGFFTRQGGVSRGIYAGLNVGRGSNDHPADVDENRSRVAAWLNVDERSLVTLHQIHSPDAIIVREPISGERPRADALVTDRPGVALGVLTADCGPVLFADAEAGVVGAAHAGWKGALEGVLEATIDAMETLGARRERIVAVLGPSISAANYEVGPEFVDRFVAADPANAGCFAPSPQAGHAMFDLRRYTLERLRAASVEADMVGHCTYADETRFYSYRRATHRGEADYGRQISAIVLEDR